MAKPLVVLDSNVIISSLLHAHSAPSRIIELWRDYHFDLLLSDYILTEVKDTLRDKQLISKYHFSPIKQSRLLTQLIHAGKICKPSAASNQVVRDPNDSPILEIALTNNANYLVTGDQDLLVLNHHKSTKPLQIVTPSSFLELFLS